MNELKNCPFCGAPAERKTWRKYRKGYAATVGCSKVGCPAKIEQATLYGTFEDAYIHAENAWNRRPEPHQLTLDELRQMDGGPVWIDGLNIWAIVCVNGETIMAQGARMAWEIKNEDVKYYSCKPEVTP